MFGLTLLGQDFNFSPMLPGSTYCWREDVDVQKHLEARQGLDTRTMTDRIVEADRNVRILPVPERKDGTGFVAIPVAKGPNRRMADLKGKVVVIGVFAAICDPSLRLLAEMAELQPKGEQYGFEVFPICLVKRTLLGEVQRRNRPRFDKTVFYFPGLGQDGLLNLGPELQAAPTTFILDRQGRVAVRWVGFYPGLLVQILKNLLREAPVSESVTSAPSTPTP